MMNIHKWWNRNTRLCGLALAALLGTSAVNAQTVKAPDEQRSALKRLDYLIGSWTGIKQDASPDGEPRQSLATDEIRWAWGEQAIIIEGADYAGTEKTQEPIGRNFAIITSHPEDPDRIRITGFTTGAINGEGVVEADGSTRWMISSGMQILIFEFEPVRPDGWLEKVRISRDAGKTWREFEITFHRNAR